MTTYCFPHQVRQRTMCNRAVQAVEVILLNGTHRDAGFYSNFYGLPVRLARASRLARACMPVLTTARHLPSSPGSPRALRGPVQGGTALGRRLEGTWRLDLRFPRVARATNTSDSWRVGSFALAQNLECKFAHNDEQNLLA